ncbi:MAG: D-alanyl-D-alanine carboxypeptidase [Sporomusaceae bacterium]|jgi:D-alanyl-D-alanine carboxypeptidase (penicillin-binding protein 5/6)|nr:D-alanyl-D-alanine carboxypeptidase [Sporomusaceae bacterium]
MNIVRGKNLQFRIILLFCCFLFLLPELALAAEPAKKIEISAKAAVLIDAKSGRILYEKNAAARRYPASTTKMMTLITALEEGKLSDTVTASKNAASTEGSSLDLVAGESMNMLDMLYGMMMVSGNDATVAIAEHISGSSWAFGRLMTQKAHSLGALNTNFVNPSGLPDDRHYSTARDLAQIAAYGYQNPLFAQIIATGFKIIPPTGKSEERRIYSENKIIQSYPGGNGVKTGYTNAAGRCLVAGANRYNTQLIAVVLDSEDIWQEGSLLLDYGFNEAKLVTVIKRGDILKTVKIKNGSKKRVALITNLDVNVPLAKAEQIASFAVRVEAPEELTAPVTAGTKVGVVKIMQGKAEIAAVDLVVAETIERKSVFNSLWSSVVGLFSAISAFWA